MKQGKTLVELAQELERQSISKHDYIAKTNAISMLDENTLSLQNGNDKAFSLLPLAHDQLSDRTGIPKKYYDRLKKDFGNLLVSSVNTLLPATTDSLLVRTLDNNARAILSNRFRCLDNKPLVETVLPILMSGGFEVASSEVTDTRLYLKVVSNQFQAEIKKGEIVRGGFWFQNSEVGHSRLAGGLFIEVLACTNGLKLSSEYGFAKNHSGKTLDFSEAVEGYFSHETRQLDDRAYWAKVKDVVTGMIGSQEGFRAACERIRQASETKLPGNDPIKLIEGVKEVFTLNTQETNGVLQHLIRGNDMTSWGLSNALTRYSQDIEDYDRATDFEGMGAKAIALSRSDWQVLEQASLSQ